MAVSYTHLDVYKRQVSNDIGYVCDTNPPPSSFGKPVKLHDSILPDMKFGKLADNINVYAEPNVNSPIVRNAGDGFLFHTIEAFPGMKVSGPEERTRMLERLARVMREPIVHFFGVFEAGRLIGVMRFYDFTMRLHETDALVGGVGGVAVDLRHKKERGAADMIRFFLDHYRDKGAALTLSLIHI